MRSLASWLNASKLSVTCGMITACLVGACVAIIAALIVKWKLPNDDYFSEEEGLSLHFFISVRPLFHPHLKIKLLIALDQFSL